jgi:hypothetical protein
MKMGDYSSLGNFWSAFVARREAVKRLKPYVEQTRCANGVFDNGRWLAPHVLGFVISAITVVARGRVATLGDEALALVQIDALAQLTGLDGGYVGEKILNLSLANDGEFAQGCVDGMQFGHALADSAHRAILRPDPRGLAPLDVALAQDAESASLDDLWDSGVAAKLRRG